MRLDADFESGYNGFRVVFKLIVEGQSRLVCIIGPNGSGKSTVLKTVLGALRPLRGAIYIDGRDVYRLSSIERAKLISAVLSGTPSLPMMRAYDVVVLGRTPHRGLFLSRHDVEVVERSLREVGAEDLADVLFDDLSDGQKQRVLIARAVAQETKVLLIDEPTTHLDPRAKHEIMRVLRDLADGGRIVIVTLHDLELLPYCDIIVGLKGGKIVFVRRPEEVCEDDIDMLYDLRERCSCQIKVHVISGLGTGREIFLTLWRLRAPFSAGPLHRGDADYVYARRFASIVYDDSMSISDVLERLRGVRVVIDSGFPVCDITKTGYDLLLQLKDKVVITFRDGLPNGVRVSSLDELSRALSELL